MSLHFEAGAHDAQHDVADLAKSESIQTPHLAEALHLQPAEGDVGVMNLSARA
jgi:hypothetical protein